MSAGRKYRNQRNQAARPLVVWVDALNNTRPSIHLLPVGSEIFPKRSVRHDYWRTPPRLRRLDRRRSRIGKRQRLTARRRF